MLHCFTLLLAHCVNRVYLHFFFRRLCRVGKMFKHTLHRKFLTFGGVFKDHTDFYKRSSAAAKDKEYSPFNGLSNLSATTYVDFIENTWDLFSFHSSTSFACKFVTGTHKISAIVWSSNQQASLFLSHCFVSSSTSSLTFTG